MLNYAGGAEFSRDRSKAGEESCTRLRSPGRSLMPTYSKPITNPVLDLVAPVGNRIQAAGAIVVPQGGLADDSSGDGRMMVQKETVADRHLFDGQREAVASRLHRLGEAVQSGLIEPGAALKTLPEGVRKLLQVLSATFGIQPLRIAFDLASAFSAGGRVHGVATRRLAQDEFGESKGEYLMGIAAVEKGQPKALGEQIVAPAQLLALDEEGLSIVLLVGQRGSRFHGTIIRRCNHGFRAAACAIDELQDEIASVAVNQKSIERPFGGIVAPGICGLGQFGKCADPDFLHEIGGLIAGASAVSEHEACKGFLVPVDQPVGGALRSGAKLGQIAQVFIEATIGRVGHDYGSRVVNLRNGSRSIQS